MPTFIPYCSLATMGLSDMKVKSFRLTVKGRGTIRPTKMAISVTRRTNTCAIVSRAGHPLAVSGHTYEGEVECHDGVCLAWLWRTANKQRSRLEGAATVKRVQRTSKLRITVVFFSISVFFLLPPLYIVRFFTTKSWQENPKKETKTNRTSYHVT